MIERPKTADKARGQWRGILKRLGIPEKALSGKHGPCPACGGEDRFRWDNQAGSGSFICSCCGAGGSGFELLKRVKGWDFATAAREVDQILGNGPLPCDPMKPQRSAADKTADCARLWKASARVSLGDPVSLWHDYRRITLPQKLDSIRYGRLTPHVGSSVQGPAMLLRVQSPTGEGVTVHRTFLTLAGRKAAVVEVRAVMPCDLPDGCAVRLEDHGELLGIAEGYETARMASALFGMPVWCALTAGNLAKFRPPAGVKELHIFGDADMTYTGQAAAWACANRNALRIGQKGCDLERVAPPRMPEVLGTDWADQLPALAA